MGASGFALHPVAELPYKDMEKEDIGFTGNPAEDMEAFKRVLASSKRIIAVAGAGLSAASGSNHL